jgi:hypothetical protein
MPQIRVHPWLKKSDACRMPRGVRMPEPPEIRPFFPSLAARYLSLLKRSKIIQKKVDTRPAICDIWRTHGNNKIK